MFDVDILVIGGGIHGAGVAQAAAAAGYSVRVLEQSACGAGTSSRSSKLIHGGLRYLESGQFNLVRECLYERSLLLQNAPELVELVPFYIPIYKHTSRRPWQIRTGLSLYALLGGLGKAYRFHSLSPRQWQQLDGLDTRDLEAVYCYYDAQTDDAALSRAVMNSARQLGAELMVPAELREARLYHDGCEVRFIYQGREYACHSRFIVNATGPWVSQVLQRIHPAPRPVAVDLVQGSHLIIKGELQQGIYYVEAPQDRRAVFVMPWQGNVMVGATETLYRGDPGAVHVLDQERSYLQEVLAHYFPERYAQSQQQLLDEFAGLRVLPGGHNQAFMRPRETLLQTDGPRQPRLLSIYGGKLTAYRSTAQRVVQQIQQSLPTRRARADVRQLRLG